MIDRRETILSRLVDVLTNMQASAMGSPWNVYRNKEDLTEAMQPAFVVFDAHESRDPAGESVTYRTAGYARVKMTPRIGLYAVGLPTDVGSTLNGMRMAALQAIFADASSTSTGSIGSVLLPNGVFFYEGASSALDRGAEMTGEMILNLAFYYPLLPTDLS